MHEVENGAGDVGEDNHLERGVVSMCNGKYNKSVRNEYNKSVGECF